MIFKKKSTVQDELNVYSMTLLQLSTKSTDELMKKYNFSNEITSLITTQIVSFSLINLFKQFSYNGINIAVFKNCISIIAKDMVNIMVEDINNHPEALAFLQNEIQKLISTYAKLPLNNSDKSKGEQGTLLWEYGKLMAKTITGNEAELEAIMECISIVTSIQSAINTNKLLNAAK